MTVLRKLTVFSVPAFLIVSGFFAAYSTRGRQTKSKVWESVKQRVKNLLIPYIIWSVAILAKDAMEGQVYSLSVYARTLLLGEAVPAYFYVPAICQLYLLAPFLTSTAKKHRKSLLFVSALVLLGFSSLWYLRLYSELANQELPLVETFINLLPGSVFVRWLFFFVLGILLGFYLKDFKSGILQRRWLLLTTTFLFAMLSVVEAEWVARVTDLDWWPNPFTLPSILYAIALVLCFLAFGNPKMTWASKQIIELGKASYGIYLLHTTVLEVGARALQKYLPNLLGSPLIFLTSIIMLAVGVPMLMMKVVAKSPVRKNYSYFFG
jgi:peptidoglycan/LPS O-acetylase OafA/YrhL